ncbi:hypothetical protein L4C38_09425 [Vibrio kasasachensis]|uniref:hypothetical protein n=1 Tax=Vibrio kasasachensis TaxID=2910248 RepID=UPI003D1211D2
MSMADGFTQAQAIIIQTSSGRRYFSRFGKAKSIQTAWSLAGAKLFLVDRTLFETLIDHPEPINEVIAQLDAKKKSYEIVTVSVEVD